MAVQSELLALESRPLISWTTLGGSGHLTYDMGKVTLRTSQISWNTHVSV